MASSPEYEMMEALGYDPASVFNAGAIAPVTFNPFPSALQGSVALGTPEPSTWALMALGFAGLGFAGLRSSRRNVALAA